MCKNSITLCNCVLGPTEASIEDFWRMVWEQEVPIIIMLTGLKENGKVKKVKRLVKFSRHFFCSSNVIAIGQNAMEKTM